MKKKYGGLVAILLGIIVVIIWWDYIKIPLLGFVPIILLLGGIFILFNHLKILYVDEKAGKFVLSFFLICLVVGCTIVFCFMPGEIRSSKGNKSSAWCEILYQQMKNREYAYYHGGGTKRDYVEAQRAYLDCVERKND